MNITIKVQNCIQCPHSTYSPEGYYCLLLMQDSNGTEYIMPEGRRGIPERCPLKRSSL